MIVEHMNRLFSRQRTPKRKPGNYVAIRGAVRADVRKRNGLWEVEIDGQRFNNSLLGDLTSQLKEMGFDVLRAADG